MRSHLYRCGRKTVVSSNLCQDRRPISSRQTDDEVLRRRGHCKEFERIRDSAGEECAMKGPYGLELSDGCKNCKLRASGFFCQMSPDAMKDFDAIKSTSTYPKGSLLFMEKQD